MIAPQYPPPKTTDRNRAALVDYLAGKDWKSAIEIGVALGWSDRKVRQVASDCDDVISYPGSPGYKLRKSASDQEYQLFRASRRAQARMMIAKVLRLDKLRAADVAGQMALPL